MQMTVAKLQDALKQFLADGMLTPDCIVAFAHTEQDDPGQLKVFPIDCERLAIVSNSLGVPPMLDSLQKKGNAMSDKKVNLDLIDELELSGLRPGRDQYSRMTLAELTAERPNEAVEIIAELPDPAEQRSALRFILRGLTVEKAVAKVVLERERVKKIRDERRAERELRESLGMTSEEIEQIKRYLKGK